MFVVFLTIPLFPFLYGFLFIFFIKNTCPRCSSRQAHPQPSIFSICQYFPVSYVDYKHTLAHVAFIKFRMSILQDIPSISIIVYYSRTLMIGICCVFFKTPATFFFIKVLIFLFSSNHLSSLQLQTGVLYDFLFSIYSAFLAFP